MGKLLFAGDTFFLEGTEGKLVTKDLLDVCGEYDYFCANIEGPVGENEYNDSLGIKFSDNQIKQIAAAGINIAILGNNHIFDCKAAGIAETIIECKKCNIQTVGACVDDSRKVYEPIIVNISGLKVAIFSAQHRYYGSTILFEDVGVADIWNHLLISKIIEIRKRVDFIVFNAHCGLENCEIPLNTWRNHYKMLIDVGVDIVIGHHPHIVQCYENYKGKSIIYSIGNFAFDLEEKYFSYVDENWYKGVVLSIEFLSKKEYDIKYIKGEYVQKRFVVKEIMNKIDDFNDVFVPKAYYTSLKKSFNEYIGAVKNALFSGEINYNLLHHYLALDEQRLVIQEYLELYNRKKEVRDYDLKGCLFDLNIYPIIIWGFGNTGINFYHFARNYQYDILGLVDSFSQNERIVFENEEVQSYNVESLSKINEKYCIVIASIYEEEIRNVIKDNDIKAEVFSVEDVYYYHFSCMMSSWRSMDWRYKPFQYNGIKYMMYHSRLEQPVILYFHGAGDCGNDGNKHVSNMGNLGEALIEYADKHELTICAPQCPLSKRWVEIDYKSRKIKYNELLTSNNVIDTVINTVKQLGHNKIYFVGYSLGAFAGWYILAKYSQLFDKAILISGGGDNEFEFDEKINDRVTIVHGEKDDIVPIQRAYEMHDATGCRIITYENKGHDLKNQVDVNSWLDILDLGIQI